VAAVPGSLGIHHISSFTPTQECLIRVVFCTQVTKAPGAEAWQLYLVDWGYNTPAERQAAAADPRITVVDLQRFQQLMGL
jgi:hypothetical protein